MKNTICNALVLVGLEMLKPPSGKAIGWISTSKKIESALSAYKESYGQKGHR